MANEFHLHCPSCARLAELLEQADSLQAHDARLETLLTAIESLINAGGGTGASASQCENHLPLLTELLPRLQKIYETLLVERHQLGKSISELDLLRGWSHQWSTGTAQSTHSIIV